MLVKESKDEGTSTATVCSYCGRSLEYPYVSQPGATGSVLGFHPICAGTFGALLSSDYLELVKVAIAKERRSQELSAIERGLLPSKRFR